MYKHNERTRIMAVTVALAGNPNCGKTTVFNMLTGKKLYVGNRPGVTVEETESNVKGMSEVIAVDLPGIYSLSPYTNEEIVTEKYLSEKAPDVILNVADASNIERSLYLTLQLTEKGIPVVLMLNMWELAEKKGIFIDTERLSELLGIEVCTASAVRGEGVREAVELALSAVNKPFTPKVRYFDRETENALKEIQALLPKTEENRRREYAVRLLEGDLELSAEGLQSVEDIRERLCVKKGEGCDELVIGQRYDHIGDIVKKCVRKSGNAMTPTEKADKVLTGRFTALPCFLLIMAAIYFLSAGSLGAYLGGLLSGFITEDLGQAARDALISLGAADWAVSLAVDGVIKGAGSVIGFLPQLGLLFLLLTAMEEFGYMARVAFIMDRFFRFFGLSGKSVISLLIASGCGVPAVMSSRTVENPAQRKMTIITSTFIPCGAKLPVISMIASVFFGGRWWVAALCYLAGIFGVLLSGLLLKNSFMFKSEDTPFIMELPDYHIPSAKNIVRTVSEKCFSFVKRAGTVILPACVIIWFLSGVEIAEGKLLFTGNPTDSILCDAGKMIAAVFEPLGFGDWRAVAASVMGLLAKEELVGVFGVVGGAENVFSSGLAAFSFLIFNLLCTPCIAAVWAIGKEMNSFKWTAFALVYQTLFAYTASLFIYQLGVLIAEGVQTRFTAAAFAAAAAVGVIVIRAIGKSRGKFWGKGVNVVKGGTGVKRRLRG